MALLRKHIVGRLIAVVTASTVLAACMTWQTQSLEPERFQSADSTQAVRLTLTSGDTLIVQGPVVTGDSLVGKQMRPGSPDSLYDRVSVPLAAISQAEVRKSDQGAAAALVVVGLIAGAVMYAASNPCYAVCSGH